MSFVPVTTEELAYLQRVCADDPDNPDNLIVRLCILRYGADLQGEEVEMAMAESKAAIDNYHDRLKAVQAVCPGFKTHEPCMAEKEVEVKELGTKPPPSLNPFGFPIEEKEKTVFSDINRRLAEEKEDLSGGARSNAPYPFRAFDTKHPINNIIDLVTYCSTCLSESNPYRSWVKIIDKQGQEVLWMDDIQTTITDLVAMFGSRLLVPVFSYDKEVVPQPQGAADIYPVGEYAAHYRRHVGFRVVCLSDYPVTEYKVTFESNAQDIVKEHGQEWKAAVEYDKLPPLDKKMFDNANGVVEATATAIYPGSLKDVGAVFVKEEE